MLMELKSWNFVGFMVTMWFSGHGGIWSEAGLDALGGVFPLNDSVIYVCTAGLYPAFDIPPVSRYQYSCRSSEKYPECTIK